ncbi:hypothetical protein CQW23_27197 [Capsicum baccatum]|uniref:Fumarylacetoacetase n=1 Tax=Capsicum baccatum TaxID=33114 RepID=A0A2G2VCZ6_CAPBA|nr:hypothetical protein CQW23_27197 [Capsicum baccatum]
MEGSLGDIATAVIRYLPACLDGATEPTLRDNADLRQLALLSMVRHVLGIVMSVSKNVAAHVFHLPIAYLGRASFIVISGTDIIRPRYNTVEQRKVLWDQLRFDVAPVISKRIRDFASCVQDLMLNEITCKGTTISPWIVTLDALEPFACEAPKPNPSPSSDHVEKSSRNYDISLEVSSAPCVHDRV